MPLRLLRASGQATFTHSPGATPTAVLGVYRKSHIPDGPGYQEKYYFNPGDTGFRVWPTRYGTIGVAICWDQWFPEAARVMALLGAELLFYPSAIGSEPGDPEYDSSGHWQRVMQGHAALPCPLYRREPLLPRPVTRARSRLRHRSSPINRPEFAEADARRCGATPTSISTHYALPVSGGVLFRDRRPDLYSRSSHSTGAPVRATT